MSDSTQKLRLGALIALVVAGGVAANKEVRQTLDTLCTEHRFRFVAPPHHLCTDNAVMIAWAGLERMALGMPSDQWQACLAPQ